MLTREQHSIWQACVVRYRTWKAGYDYFRREDPDNADFIASVLITIELLP